MELSTLVRPYLYVALGGIAGVLLRYQAGIWVAQWNTSSFPWATLGINILGSFIIGFVMHFALSRGMNGDLRLLLTTGFCGGFTTFSTFSYELILLFREEQLTLAFAYLGASITLGPLMCLAGYALAAVI